MNKNQAHLNKQIEFNHSDFSFLLGAVTSLTRPILLGWINMAACKHNNQIPPPELNATRSFIACTCMPLKNIMFDLMKKLII